MERDIIVGPAKQLLFALSVLAGLTLFFYLFENWRGAREREKLLRESERSGERLDWQAYVRRPVPDGENFMAAPLMKAIGYKGQVKPDVWAKFEDSPLSGYSFDCAAWQRSEAIDLGTCRDYVHGGARTDTAASRQTAAADVLAALANLEPEFAELRQASRRPFSQFWRSPDPEGPVPDFVSLRTLGYYLALRASSELALGKTEDAFADAYVVQRMSGALGLEPNLVGTMVGCAILGNMGLQTFWEGLASGQWSEAQLRQFQACFTSTDLLADFDRAMRGGERAGLYSLVQRRPAGGLRDWFGGSTLPGVEGFLEQLYYRSWPRGWMDQNVVYHYRLLQRTAFASYDLRAHRVYPQKCVESIEILDQAKLNWNPFAHLAAVGLPNFTRAAESVARVQTFANEAALACALEQYRRQHQQYPTDLAALMPEFIDRLPHDLITGGPLHYSRTPSGKYLLYSVGWDEKDDAGVPEEPASQRGPSSARPSGDWVWPVDQRPQMGASKRSYGYV